MVSPEEFCRMLKASAENPKDTEALEELTQELIERKHGTRQKNNLTLHLGKSGILVLNKDAKFTHILITRTQVSLLLPNAYRLIITLDDKRYIVYFDYSAKAEIERQLEDFYH